MTEAEEFPASHSSPAQLATPAPWNYGASEGYDIHSSKPQDGQLQNLKGTSNSSYPDAPHGNGGLHPNAAPFVPMPPAYSLGEVMGSPVAETQVDFMPQGMDRDAYIAGERAALARALQMMLPSQQTLGLLSGGLQRLEQRVQEEAGHARQGQLVAADIRAVAQSLHQRLDHLERVRLPAMDRNIQHAIENPLSQEFQATLLGLQDAIGIVGAQSGYAPYSLTGFAVRQLTWLGGTASLYAQKALSKADVAAIFLSRKILLDTRVAGLIGPPEQTEEGDSRRTTRGTRAALGALLFLAAVESAWQMHSRALNYVPQRVRKATQPAQLGLQILRGATWAASLTLSAVYFRRACFEVADRSISGVDQVLKRCYSLRPFSSPTDEQLSAPPSEDHCISSPFEQPKEGADDPEMGPLTSPTVPNGPPQRQRSIFDTPPPSPPP